MGIFPSTKNGRMIAWESQLEERACYLFEFTPAIKVFREQPIKIEYPYDGSIRTYIADFKISLCDGRFCYIEIKPLGKLFHLEDIYRYRSIAMEFGRKRDHWFVLTEEDLPSPIKFQNLKLLRSYLRTPKSDSLIQSVADWLHVGTRTLEALFKKVGSPAIAYALIADHKVVVDLESPLHLQTIISYSKENCYENFLFSCRTGPDFERHEISYLENIGERCLSIRALER